MTFSTNTFVMGFLPGLLLIFWIFRNKATLNNRILFVSNIIFYIWGGAVFLILLLCMSFFIWGATGMIYKSNVNRNKQKKILIISSFIAFIPLFFVKYSSFIIDNINMVFHTEYFFPEIIMPIGISFYTFQAVSLLADTYFGRIQERPSLYKIIFYLSFFPTVVSGPIVRYNTIISKWNCCKLKIENINEGLSLFVIGLLKKVILANNLAPLADFYFDGVSNQGDMSVFGLWIGSIAYSLQLYFDFSGYSDMAIGIAQLFDFKLPKNFTYPYMAKSIQEFWRRWHISLSQWFRDYIYIPLGGSKVKAGRHMINMFIVWIFTGIWHGANWTFIIWGLGYYGLLLFEKYCGRAAKFITKGILGHIFTLFFVNLLWVFFRADSLYTASRYIAGMFGKYYTSGIKIERIAIRFLPFLGICILLCFPWNQILEKFKNQRWYQYIEAVFLAVVFVLAICSLANDFYKPFIYGNF